MKVSLEELVKVGAHFGHQTKRWNPKMDEYLYGSQSGVHIFDLISTKQLLDSALEAITKASKEGKKILIVGTKKQAKEKVVEIAKEAGIFYVDERWLGGTVTNFPQIKKSTKKLTDMKASKKAGEYKEFTKKERLLLDREIARLERFFGGIETMEDKPDMLIIVDIKRESGVVKEAQMGEIDTVAIVDSNCDPEPITYPIPMNDDATRALSYALDLFKEAVLEGKKGSKVKKSATKKEQKKSSKEVPESK